MNVYVKMAFSENIARKVCTLFLIDIDNVFFFFLFFNCAIPFYIFTQNKSTPPKFRSIAQGRGPRMHMTTPQTQNDYLQIITTKLTSNTNQMLMYKFQKESRAFTLELMKTLPTSQTLKTFYCSALNHQPAFKLN